MLTFEQVKEKYGNVVLKLDTYFYGEKYSLISLKGRKGGKDLIVTYIDNELRSNIVNEFCPTMNTYEALPWKVLLDGDEIYTREEQPKSVPTEEANTNEC
jgi:hypothetical protein